MRHHINYMQNIEACDAAACPRASQQSSWRAGRLTPSGGCQLSARPQLQPVWRRQHVKVPAALARRASPGAMEHVCSSYGARGPSSRPGARNCAHELAFTRACTLPAPRGARAVRSAHALSACTPLSCVAREYLLLMRSRRCSVLLPPEAW